MRRIAIALMIVGAVFMLIAIGWWWLTYRDVIGYAYIPAREAGYCLVGETDICALARVLCRGAHPLALANYSSISLWLGFAMLCSGLWMDGWRRPAEHNDRGIVPDEGWF
jgi:hypothetical protein